MYIDLNFINSEEDVCEREYKSSVMYVKKMSKKFLCVLCWLPSFVSLTHLGGGNLGWDYTSMWLALSHVLWDIFLTANWCGKAKPIVSGATPKQVVQVV